MITYQDIGWIHLRQQDAAAGAAPASEMTDIRHATSPPERRPKWAENMKAPSHACQPAARSRLAAALAVAALVGTLTSCSDEAAPPPVLSGQWQSNWAGGSQVTIGFNEQTGGAVTGTGNLVNGQITAAVTVTGSHTHPDVNLNFTITGYQPANFAGWFTAAWTIRGVLNGSGFVNDSIEFGKL